MKKKGIKIEDTVETPELNYTVVPNGLWKNEPTVKFEANVKKKLEEYITDVFQSTESESRSVRLMTGPLGAQMFQQALEAEGARLLSQPIRAQLDTPAPPVSRDATQLELINYLDQISNENV